MGLGWGGATSAVLLGGASSDTTNLVLGTITSGYQGANTVTVRIDGSATTITAVVPRAQQQFCVTGARIMGALLGRKFYITDVMPTNANSPLIQSANTVVSTNGSGMAQVNFAVSFPVGSSPVVVAMGGNAEIIGEDPSTAPTAAYFIAYCRNAAGAALTNAFVRILYVATLTTPPPAT